MAEIRRNDEDVTLRSDIHPRENLAAAGAEPLPAGHALPGGPEPTRATATGDPEVVRAEIAQTRARMSETIDEIEDALVRRKERIQERLDVFSYVRERPLMAAGAVFGVGLLLGLLTGGEDEEEYEYEEEREEELHAYRGDSHWRRRSEMWESRARRLLRVAREQEDEIRDLQERYGELYAEDLDYDHDELEEETPRATRPVGSTLKQVLRDGFSDVLNQTMRELAGRGR